jgi:hypothetical protein
MSRPGRTITRRTMLRGAGVLMGLPLLDAMRGASALARAVGDGSGASGHPVRMACLFFPNGVNSKAWTPEGTGRDYALSRTLQPLASLKDEVLVLTNLSNQGHQYRRRPLCQGRRVVDRDHDPPDHRLGPECRRGRRSTRSPPAGRPLHAVALAGTRRRAGDHRRRHQRRLHPAVRVAHLVVDADHAGRQEINPKLAFDRLFRPDRAPGRIAGRRRSERPGSGGGGRPIPPAGSARTTAAARRVSDSVRAVEAGSRTRPPAAAP